MIVLAVLQNQWFKDPDRVRAMLADKTPEFRRIFIKRALFAGCKTGRVLKSVFGEHVNTIVWEEASPHIGGFSASAFPADSDHLRKALEEVRPDIVLAFGAIAISGVRPLWPRDKLIAGPHPTNRARETVGLLYDMKALFERALKGKVEV